MHNLKLILLGIFIFLVFFFIWNNFIPSQTTINSHNMLIFEDYAPGAGDSKIIDDDCIIYSDNGQIVLKKYSNNINDSKKHEKSINYELDNKIIGNWVAAIKYNNQTIVVTEGFADKDLRIYSLEFPVYENDPNIVKTKQLSIISKDDNTDLLIDPAIIWIPTSNDFNQDNQSCMTIDGLNHCEKKINSSESSFLLAITKIRGAINSGDPNNIGHYEIVFYKSNDLVNWKEASKIENQNHNLEDIKLYYNKNNRKVYALYEVEKYDKGPSEIHISTSSDFGLTWSDNTVLNDGNDNEPVALDFCEFPILYFSSDKDNPRKSYEGANGYVVRLDDNNNLLGDIKKLPVGDRVLLLDASRCNTIVGIRDYLDTTKKSLFVYSLDVETLLNNR